MKRRAARFNNWTARLKKWVPAFARTTNGQGLACRRYRYDKDDNAKNHRYEVPKVIRTYERLLYHDDLP